MIGIYLIINSINGKLYVGSSIDIKTRWLSHIWHLTNMAHKNKHLQAAWNKYGIETFHFCIVEECSVDKLYEIEQLWIDGSFGKSCYNLSPLADRHSGNKPSEETKLKLSLALKGRKHTEATKLKMKLNYNRDVVRTNKPPNWLGKKHTEESKRKISEGLRKKHIDRILKLRNCEQSPSLSGL